MKTKKRLAVSKLVEVMTWYRRTAIPKAAVCPHPHPLSTCLNSVGGFETERSKSLNILQGIVRHFAKDSRGFPVIRLSFTLHIIHWRGVNNLVEPYASDLSMVTSRA